MRFSGSGDGCGEHWPLCYGVLIPDSPEIRTLIEYSHRVKSGLFGVLVLFLPLFAFKAFLRGHPARFFSLAALVFTIIEGLIGARLVLAGLVGQNDSLERGVTIALHLVNTFILLGTLLGCWYFSKKDCWQRLAPSKENRSLFWTSVVIFVLIALSGSIASLSNTLFPSSNIISGFFDDFSSDSHLFVRLRILHPIFSTLGFVGLIFMIGKISAKIETVHFLGRIFPFLVFANFILGILILVTLGPLYGKLAHLFLADLVWLSLCIFGFGLYYKALDRSED